MQTDYERYIKMSSLAQIGWWEADFAAGHYLCSDFLCELLGLEGDTISFQDFQKLIREDYREQIIQEFRANANIHRNFYEQTFPVRSRYGEIWLHTRLAHREKGTGTRTKRRFEKGEQSASSSEFYLPVFAPFPSR